MHVFLTGFMGAGKTTVGRILAKRMQRPFVDLDERIEEMAGQTIREIFATSGESAFRKLESTCLLNLPDGDPSVVALGGGAQLSTENRQWLAEHGTTVWIDVPFATLAARLGQDQRKRRPLFGNQERSRGLYEARRAAYGDSDLRIEVCSTDSAEEIAKTIQHRLKEMQCAI